MRLCLRLPRLWLLWRRRPMAATSEAPAPEAAAGAPPASDGAPPAASLPHEAATALAGAPSAPEALSPAPLLLLAPPPPPPPSPEADRAASSAISPLQALPFELLEHLVRRLLPDDRCALHLTSAVLSAAVAAAVEHVSIQLDEDAEAEEDPAALLRLAARLAARCPRLSSAQLPLASAWPAALAAEAAAERAAGGGGGGALRTLLGRITRLRFGNTLAATADEAARRARAETIAPLLASGLLSAVAEIQDLGPRCSGAVLAAMPSGGLRSLRALEITSFPGATPAAVACLSALTALTIAPEEAPAFDPPTAAALAGLPSLRRLSLKRMRGGQYAKWMAALPAAGHLTELLLSGGWGTSEPVHIDLASVVSGCAASLARLRLWGFDVASGIDAEEPEEVEEAEAQAAAWGRLTSLTCLQCTPPAYLLYGAAAAPALARLEMAEMSSSPEGFNEMLGDLLGLSALRELILTPEEGDVEGDPPPCISPDAARCLLACPCLEFVGRLCGCSEGGARALAAEARARAPRPLVLDIGSSDSEGEA